MVEEALKTPNGWLYEIDSAWAPDGPDGAVPPEGIKGAWKIGPDGELTGEYHANDNYRPRPSAHNT
jgi:hypothetical protein